KLAKKQLDAKANDLEKIATDAALFVADTLAFKLDPGVRALLAEPTYPFAVHRFLGLARTHLDAESLRKSMVMYDRALELTKTGAVPEAMDGRQRAESELVGRGESTFGARADLAPSAAERAEVALKHGADQEAVRALEAYIRYTPERALRWTLEVPLAKGA